MHWFWRAVIVLFLFLIVSSLSLIFLSRLGSYRTPLGTDSFQCYSYPRYYYGIQLSIMTFVLDERIDKKESNLRDWDPNYLHNYEDPIMILNWRWVRTKRYGFHVDAYDYRSGNNKYGIQTEIHIALLWFLLGVFLFLVYPTIAIIRGPYRRCIRRMKGLCIKCGYNLTGNTSGICPECGEKVVSAVRESKKSRKE